METLSPEQEDFGSFVGQTQDVGKDEEAVCEWSTITSRRATNLADYALRQGRSFRPYAERKASFEECQWNWAPGSAGREACETEEIAEVKAMSKRKIFDEMMEGVRAMKSHREGKITLRTYNVEAAPLPKVDSKLIRDTRKRLHCSRAVFARKLRINERTLEKWEQGRSKPNPQAAALVLLVRKYPDTLERLERVAVGKHRSLRGQRDKGPRIVGVHPPPMPTFGKPAVVDKGQSTRIEEPTLLCNHVDYFRVPWSDQNRHKI
jgi:putative transcriptional regulator